VARGRSPTCHRIAPDNAQITIPFGFKAYSFQFSIVIKLSGIESIGGRTAKALASDAEDSLLLPIALSSISCARSSGKKVDG
jgi:hypothetical protein